MKNKKTLFEAAKALSDKERVTFTIDDWNQWKIERGEKDIIIPMVTTSDNLEKILKSHDLIVDLKFHLHKTKDVNESIWWTLYKEHPLSIYIMTGIIT